MTGTRKRATASKASTSRVTALNKTVRQAKRQPDALGSTPSAEPVAASSGPKVDLAGPKHVANLAYLTCFRGRKFARSRFARFVQERIGGSDTTERHVSQLPVEAVALFLARELRPVNQDRPPMNEWFELPDGRLLEFVGDHMEPAETILRLLLAHDEGRLEHVVELVWNHDRGWLLTLALEARDAHLMELGLPDLDDVERLFTPWHATLLIRKLQATTGFKTGAPARGKVKAQQVLDYIRGMPEPSRRTALERLHFLLACQAVHDAKRLVTKLTAPSMDRSTTRALQILARGVYRAGGQLALLATPQMATLYRLGLAAER